MSALTNLPGGVSSMGIPILGVIGPIPTGKCFFVSSVIGNDGNRGTDNKRPVATMAGALSKCVAARGDVIYLMPGHSETISAAAGINVNVEGVSIVGCGFGDDRATFTFGTSTAATMTITAADVTMRNFVTVCNIASLVSPIVASGANCTLDQYEHIDLSAALTALRAVLTTAGATNLKINMKYTGLVATTVNLNAIKLVGVAGANIIMDFYGKAATAVVEFATTLCSNVEIYGYMYNAAVTDGSKNVVDTITGSIWFANIQDGSAGAPFNGGSASALKSYSAIGAGSFVLVQKTVVSSAVLSASAIDLTTVAAGGDFYIENITVQSDATGLAGGTNFQILQNGAKGLANVLVEAVANLGANKTVDLYTASVTKQRMTLKAGQKLQMQSTVAPCTGAGTVDITVVLARVTAGSTITNA